MQVVWFKRDLRVEDHSALSQAARVGRVLPLYVLEKELWQQPDASARQWYFVAETLAELPARLGELDQPLAVRVDEVTSILAEIKKLNLIEGLWSHEETGNDWTYRRDLRVAAWCRQHGVRQYEVQNHGVFRRLKSRNGWAGRWDGFMRQPVSTPVALEPVQVELGSIPSARDLGLSDEPCEARQAGGRRAGLERLNSFLLSAANITNKKCPAPLRGRRLFEGLTIHSLGGAFDAGGGAENRRAAAGIAATGNGMAQVASVVFWPAALALPLYSEARRRTAY